MKDEVAGNASPAAARPPLGASPTGTDAPVQITLRLRRDPAHEDAWRDALRHALDPEITHRQFLSSDQIDALDSPAAADVAQLHAFAARHGLTVVSTGVTDARNVVLQGTARQIQTALGGKIRLFEFFREDRWRHGLTENERAAADAGEKVSRPMIRQRSYINEPELPADLHDAVEGVIVRQAPAGEPRYRVAAAGAAHNAKNPRQWADFYAATDATGQPLRADGVTVGIVSFGGGYDPANLQQTCTDSNVPVPAVTNLLVDGATPNYTGDPNSADVENELDLASVAGGAPGANILFALAPNTNQAMADVFNAIVKDGRASVVSMSWGDLLKNYTPAEKSLINAALQRMAVAGITFLESSGDNGDREKNSVPTPDYPASDSLTTAVGGLEEPGSPSQTRIWNDSATGGGIEGAGFGPDPKPSWQSAVPGTQRQYPDWVADAAPATGMTFTFAGSPITVGGTSEASPLTAGFVATVVAANGGRRLGNLNPILWQQWLGTPAVRDVTLGGTEDYKAGPGPDVPSGVGAPVVRAMVDWIKANPVGAPQPPQPSGPTLG